MTAHSICPAPTGCCLKVDVDTHDGLRYGVPRLLDAFRAHGLRASFFLAFGPDNAGKAVWRLFGTRGFLRKMLRTGAPRLYGWRTILSGTLLPARLIGAGLPDIVRRVLDEGHEVGVHGWDHRLWQDRLDSLTEAEIGDQLGRAFDAYERILGTPPSSTAAPGWYATPRSLCVQDALGLHYASDLRGGVPCYPKVDGYRSTTLQLPTTQPCLEELLALSHRDPAELVERVLEPAACTRTMILPLHAEVEGGVHQAFLEQLLRGVRDRGLTVRPLGDWAADLKERAVRLPVLSARHAVLPGRAASSLVVEGAVSPP